MLQEKSSSVSATADNAEEGCRRRQTVVVKIEGVRDARRVKVDDTPTTFDRPRSRHYKSMSPDEGACLRTCCLPKTKRHRTLTNSFTVKTVMIANAISKYAPLTIKQDYTFMYNVVQLPRDAYA